MEDKLALPVGISKFRKARELNCYYVDKTSVVDELLKSKVEVTLITRPRRFGKTLTMTMIRDFFDITQESKEIFNGLSIMDSQYASEINSTPVIFVSFKDCKGSLRNILLKAKEELYHLFLTYTFTLDALQPYTRQDYEEMIVRLRSQQTNDLEEINTAIALMSRILYEYYNKKVIILIDEYDTPMISAYEGGTYDKIKGLFITLYGSALKDNQYLQFAVMTGIHRIAKENIFSDLNNLEVCTVVDTTYSDVFGLTEEETKRLLGYYDLELTIDAKQMYNGYLFGNTSIYNPWSIINYAKKRELASYWVNTANNEMLVQAMLSSSRRVQKNFEQLLSQGQTIVSVDLQSSFFEMNQPATLWGLFLNSGYLTVTSKPEANELQTEVRIPNNEVKTSFRKLVERYGGFEDNSLTDLFGALLRKNVDDFKDIYEDIILTCTSFHDGSVENAYHMLFLGMCVYLTQDYRVSSNIEHGHGRADIYLEAKRPSIPNFIIEFKQGEDIEKLSKEAMKQIHQKKYYAGLTGETLLLGIAHNIKQCQIASETIDQ